jgi:hypothetical protein
MLRIPANVRGDATELRPQIEAAMPDFGQSKQQCSD